ncbi:CbtB domain-containing protein [Catelliglobosispora koreensis]|uniref:CbtB domain-containing protein n=1 Tax=Catelliglobosispora koreensis TaxID=129052 RepID=UPI0004765836|nr:CbtB-domain containing protein [Catelliglobosispora koreensis]
MSKVTAQSVPQAAIAAVRLKDIVLAAVMVALALFILYVVMLDQGALLSAFVGDASWTNNYLHELAHDGRHVLAAPCH